MNSLVELLSLFWNKQWQLFQNSKKIFLRLDSVPKITYKNLYIAIYNIAITILWSNLEYFVNCKSKPKRTKLNQECKNPAFKKVTKILSLEFLHYTYSRCLILWKRYYSNAYIYSQIRTIPRGPGIGLARAYSSCLYSLYKSLDKTL